MTQHGPRPVRAVHDEVIGTEIAGLDQIAQELANPISNIWSLQLQNNMTFLRGDPSHSPTRTLSVLIGSANRVADHQPWPPDSDVSCAPKAADSGLAVTPWDMGKALEKLETPHNK